MEWIQPALDRFQWRLLVRSTQIPGDVRGRRYFEPNYQLVRKPFLPEVVVDTYWFWSFPIQRRWGSDRMEIHSSWSACQVSVDTRDWRILKERERNKSLNCRVRWPYSQTFATVPKGMALPNPKNGKNGKCTWFLSSGPQANKCNVVLVLLSVFQFESRMDHKLRRGVVSSRARAWNRNVAHGTVCFTSQVVFSQTHSNSHQPQQHIQNSVIYWTVK